ncbi:MAG TPA: 3D domain-containing protein [Solirubrobacteraceae bacterium]|nr:3D domain-containing protein [Solirubrobacteraceae bacterium]
MRHIRHPLATTATLCAVATAMAAAPALAAVPPSGGAGFGAILPSSSGAAVPAPPSHSHGKWLRSVTVSEYWPAPERWFTGRAVAAAGLPGKHRIDWLYSATGVTMEGQGIGLDGRLVHVDALGNGGWVTAAGKPTDPLAGWSGGTPYWRAGGYWQNRHRAVTFPLAAGGWSNGAGRRYVALQGVSFAPGPARSLHFLQSIAVDPSKIPLGSRVYIPAYRHDGHGGWFVAQDTGGGITGRHVDIYRAPPASESDGGQYLTGQRIYVIKPSP